MTNSEEPSAPDGISSMNVSESFGSQHNQLHHNNFGNYVNGDLKQSLGNGTSIALAPPPGLCASGPAYEPATALTSSSSSDPDSYTLQLPASSSSPGAGASQQQPPLPFSLICGEDLEHKAEVSDGILVLTNYRLFLQTKQATYNLPLGLLESVECRDIFFLHLNCKDARCIRCTFPNNEAVLEMLKRIQAAISPTKKVEESFAFSFFKETQQNVSEEVKAHLGWDLPPFQTPKERFDSEVKRMQFNVQGPWRVSDENKDYELCSSYPTHIIVPCVMDKRKLEQVACFRSARRFPAVVWRHKGNGAVISRCSQPEVGWFGWRSNEDEELVQNIVLACADNGRAVPEPANRVESKSFSDSPGGDLSNGMTPSIGACNSLSSIEVVPDPPNIKKLLILDARSYSTAVVNRARGGGCECLEYYTNCEIQFMNLANIHSIRKSFMNVRQLCSLPSDQANNWFSQLESCKWLQHMSGLMKAAVTVATAIENEGRPVMVHCSDGWDRTPQIVALAEILLDPYYRSLEGFQVLVEREWLDFGHKFADRCGQGLCSDDTNERCPVFLQWLDCLHQLIRQFPTAFEFNLTFLVKLAQHTYSNLFGTFLCNTSKERYALKIHKLTHSIWSFLRAPANHEKFRNNLYSSCDKVLWPLCEMRELKLWTPVYLGYDNPSASLTEVINPSQESSPAPSVAADCENSERMSNCKTLDKSKTRSCENLHSPHAGGLQRRQSDPNLCDSFLGLDSEEVEIRCIPQAEKMLTAASRDIDEVTAGTKSQGEGLILKDCEMGAGCDGEDLSENEDTETTSEEKSESTVINVLTSIESSTDTLVAETCGMPEYMYGNSKLVNEVNIKTDCMAKEHITSDVLRKTDGESILEHNESRSLTENETEDLGKRKTCEPIEATVAMADKSMKDLAQAVSDLEGILGNQHCEVCATSRKLLLGDAVTGNMTITSACTYPSSSNNSNANIIQPMPASTSANGSKLSSYNTPVHSRTPSTGIPATPEESSYQQTKNGYPEKWNHDIPQQSSVAGAKSSYDVDGLEPLHDEVQSRLNVIVSGYRGQIDILQKELQMTRDALMKQVCHKCTHHMVDHRPEDAVSVADSLCSGENQSVGQDSHSSEISWEAVDEKDTRPPLWLPDFAVTRCMGCEATFWLGKRKHHCRSCGKIFCADCSENTITIPSEQIFTPVRVCWNCFTRLNNHCPNGSGQNQVLNGNGIMNGGNCMSSHNSETSRSNPRGGATEYLQPDSLSPKTRSFLQRRLSEELPRKQHPHWSKTSSELNVCNGVKSKTKHVSNSNSIDVYPSVHNQAGDGAAYSNGSSFH